MNEYLMATIIILVPVVILTVIYLIEHSYPVITLVKFGLKYIEIEKKNKQLTDELVNTRKERDAIWTLLMKQGEDKLQTNG